MNSGYNPQPQEPFQNSTMTAMPVSQLASEARMNFVRKTYVLFMAGILSCIVAGTLTLSVAPILAASLTLLKIPILAILLLFGASIAAQAVSEIEGLNYAALFGFTAFMGFLFSPVVAMYAPAVVGQAAFLTILIFGSLTAYVFLTKKDFSFLGGMLFVGLVALILGGLANLFFFRSSGASYWMAWITLFLFSGYVLYDTSNIMNRYSERSYCSAALALFLDFFNMFMALLRILGGGRR